MAGTNGGALIAAVLREHGVKWLFTLCGGHISPILVEAKAQGLGVIDLRDEKSAVFAADAVARMTGIPGVAAVTAGPGVTNTVTAVKNAQLAQSPLVLFGGATATVLKGRGALQDIDQLSLMRPITKWVTTVKTRASLAPTVRRALETARSGIPGPVFVEVPIDLLYDEKLVRQWYLEQSGVQGSDRLGARLLKLYLEGHLLRQFHAPHVAAPRALGKLRPTSDHRRSRCQGGCPEGGGSGAPGARRRKSGAGELRRRAGGDAGEGDPRARGAHLPRRDRPRAARPPRSAPAPPPSRQGPEGGRPRARRGVPVRLPARVRPRHLAQGGAGRGESEREGPPQEPPARGGRARPPRGVPPPARGRRHLERGSLGVVDHPARARTAAGSRRSRGSQSPRAHRWIRSTSSCASRRSSRTTRCWWSTAETSSRPPRTSSGRARP